MLALSTQKKKQLLAGKFTKEARVRGVANIVLAITHILLWTVLPTLDAAG
jgi:hypothetical protein